MTFAIANISTGSKKKMFGISYAVVRPKMPFTILNFVCLKSYTVQIRVVHCTGTTVHVVEETLPQVAELSESALLMESRV